MRGWRFIVLLPICIVVAAVSMLDLVSTLGGLGRIVSELEAVRGGELIGKGPQVYAVTMLLPTILQWYLVHTIRQGWRGRYFVLALCLASSLLGGLLGFRSPVIALLIQTLVIWYLLTKRPSRRTLLLGLATFLPIVTLAGVARLLVNEASLDVMLTADPQAVFAYLSDTTLTRVRGIEAFSLLKEYVDVNGYGLFLDNIVETAVAVLPSGIFPKPTSLTESIATSVFGASLFEAGIIRDIYGGVSYTFISEGYWNAGYLGVLIYGVLFGLVFKSIEKVELQPTPTNWEIAVYKAVAGFAPILVEAPQLGINAVVVNLFINAALLVALSIPSFAAHRPTYRISRDRAQ
jgi:hypothetical protein